VSNLNRMPRRAVFLVAVALCIGVVLPGLTSQAEAGDVPQDIVSATPQPQQPNPAGAGSDPLSTAPGSLSSPPSIFLPLAQMSSTVQLSYRLGVGMTYGPLSNYPEFPSLRAGWYQNWQPQWNPERPNGMEFAQTVRVHQLLDGCELWSVNAADREKCPYKRPYGFWSHPSMDALPQHVRDHPGALWMIGNETDRRDWSVPGGAMGQDEMLPEAYAMAYHDIYYAIKAADPSAKVSPGGIIQPTPLRLDYLSRIWDSYRSLYKTDMPVDVWNIHNFIMQEEQWAYGAGIPPGIDAERGMVYDSDLSHVDMTIFDNQIRAFRQWMKDRGQQNKPLIVSEYGVTYPDGLHGVNFGPAVVQDFMIKSFDYYLYTKDCSIGMPSDGCRLVQRWSWFCLAGVEPAWGINNYVALFDPVSRQITSTGAKYREYSLSHLHELACRY
jgi:hypothetical protein